MSRVQRYSYFIPSVDHLPLHLKDRVPFILPNTEALLRKPESEVVAGDGRVVMAGAIEFQTQISPGILTDICDPAEMFTVDLTMTHRFRSVYDPAIQRGVKDTSSGPKEYLRPSQIEAMMKDIAENKFECPQLMWNLRAESTVWMYVRDTRELRIYEGVATRPDTNHRHHAIIGVHRLYLQWVRDTGSTEMGEYNPHRTYGLVIYTDNFQDEGHRFYVYNFLGWRVSTSTAHYIESKTGQPNLYSRLAREIMEKAPVLGAANVEILGNHLSRNSAKMVTFGTLVDALRSGFPMLDENTYTEILPFMLHFIDGLSMSRPREIALLSVAQRQRIRLASVADQAVMWHAYIRIAARTFEIGDGWADAVTKLALPYHHGPSGYQGDLFSRDNPAWAEKGVIAPGKKGPRVVNNRQARQGAFELLCEVSGVAPRSLASLNSSVTEKTDDDEDTDAEEVETIKMPRRQRS
jgi:hypothetical protein